MFTESEKKHVKKMRCADKRNEIKLVNLRKSSQYTQDQIDAIPCRPTMWEIAR